MSIRARLKAIVEDDDTIAGRVFNGCIQLLILLSLLAFSLETLPDLTAGHKNLLVWTEVVVIALFTIEYLLRCWVADRVRDYMFSFLGIIDLLAILPFYLVFAFNLQALRAIRLLYLFRILKILRFSSALKHFSSAMRMAAGELTVFFLATLIMMYLAATGIYFFEHDAQPENFPSVVHSLWWSTTTLTTVGYGDIYPITVGGKIFTFVVLMLGLGIVGVPTAIIASALTAVRRSEETEEGGAKP